MNLRQRRWLELLKYYGVDILYHPRKTNVVADALIRKSMGSLSYVQPEKREIAREVQQLANLGVRLLDSGDARITIKDTVMLSLVAEIKERQHEDPILVHYRDKAPRKEKTPFVITGDGCQDPAPWAATGTLPGYPDQIAYSLPNPKLFQNFTRSYQT